MSNWKWKRSSVRPSVKSFDSVTLWPDEIEFVQVSQIWFQDVVVLVARVKKGRVVRHIRIDAARYREQRSKLAAIVPSGGSTRFVCISCISLGSLNNCFYSSESGTKIKRFDIFNRGDVIRDLDSSKSGCV